jgi:hypothetical protein
LITNYLALHGRGVKIAYLPYSFKITGHSTLKKKQEVGARLFLTTTPKSKYNKFWMLECTELHILRNIP